MNRATYFQPGHSYQTYSSNHDVHWPDLYNLLPTDVPDEASDLFKLLAHDSSCITLQADPSGQVLLAGSYQTARNYIRYNGHSGLCIGYPFLYIRTESSFLAVPIYLWPVSLEAQIQGAPLWFLKKRPGKAYINPWFYAPEGFGFSRSVLDQLSLLPPPPDPSDLADFVKVLVDDGTKAPALLQPMPGIQQLGSIDQELLVFPCATIGVFPPSSPPLVALPFPQRSALPGNTYSALLCSELYPDQEYLFSSITKNSHVLIHGDAGTGKTHLAVQTALAALDQGRSSLFVAPSLHVLQQIYEELARHQAAAHTFILRDLQEDTPVWWASQASQVARQPGKATPGLGQGALTLERLQMLTLNLKAAYRSVRTPVFGTLTWPEIAGKYLTLSQATSKDWLGAHLQPTEYAFTIEEYERYGTLIREAQDLFFDSFRLDHPLAGLHPRFFQQKPIQEAASAAAHQLEAFERRISSLLDRYRVGISLYSDSLRQYLEKEYRQLRSALEALKDALLEKNNLFGSNWINQWRRSNWLITLSPKARLLSEAAEEIQRLMAGVEAQVARLTLWGFTFSDTDEPTLVEVSSFIEKMEEGLKNWQGHFSEFIQSELLRLSTQHAQPEIIPADLTAGLESAMDILMADIQTECLPEVEANHQLLTLQKRQKRLTEILRTVAAIRASMTDFTQFYPWQQSWLRLPFELKKIIAVLVQLKPTNWEATFQVWYLDQVLFRTQSADLPDGRLTVAQYANLHITAREAHQLARKIAWSTPRTDGYKKHKVKPGTALTTLLKDAPEWVVRPFPIILALQKPGVELAGYASKPLFSHLFIMDAEATSAKEAAVLCQVSQQTTAFTQHPHTSEIPENFLACQALKNNWKAGQLHFISRWYPHHPVQLGKGSRITDAAANKPVHTHLHNLFGGYDPVTQTNHLEAEAIFTFLNNELSEQFRAYPSVHIIAFTWNQKYLLSHLLLQKKRTDAAFAERCEQLERSGLGVYHLSEIAGLKNEVCLISGTFGQFPLDWLSAQEIAEVYPSLHLLAGLGYRTQHLFNSIPFEELERQAEKDLAIPASYWSNYLLLLHPRYAERTETLEKRFEKQYPPAPIVRTGEEMLSFIVASLRPYLENTPIQIHTQTGHLELPLFIPACPPDGKPVCLILDGFLWQGPETNSWWESQKLAEMASHGIRCVHTWSVRWWQQPAQEARRVAAQILSLSS